MAPPSPGRSRIQRTEVPAGPAVLGELVPAARSGAAVTALDVTGSRSDHVGATTGG